MRTLEQKISDAGPPNQRIDPHILTEARQALATDGTLQIASRSSGHWYYLTNTPEQTWRQRLAELEPIARRIQTGNRPHLIGQALEIAVYKALELTREQHQLLFFGGFPNLDADDSRLFQKQDPPSMVSGRSLSGDQKLDFYLAHPTARLVGVEVKNIREWLYPDSEEMRETLAKCCAIDAIPVIICRRYAYSTYSVLHKCGVLLFQNYNQIYPVSERELATQARHKRLLGYHDIRVGNEPNSRLLTFVGNRLPRLLQLARQRFNKYQDLLSDFAHREETYQSFAARARRRADSVDENYGPPEPDFEGEE